MKIDPQLWARVQQAAKKNGYSSPEEFVEHALQKELDRLEESEDRDEVERRLRGLGYLE